ncbi:sugar kinase [Anaerolineae bacterium CFX9]|jgi:2-dehydro-3-deoxygluconokinase|nr:sugar kinase [Anaerolineae bacterium CFX9]
MTRYDITTFGEPLLRLSVPAGERLETATRLDLFVGGAEINTVCGLARLGRAAAWCGALPEGALGRRVAEHLRAAGVDTEPLIWREDGRLGTYYVEFAVPPRSTQVAYDRGGALVTELTEDDLNWDRLLDTRAVYLTGITPALSPSCRSLCAAIISRAKQEGIPICFDINYRARLWRASAARSALMPLMQGADLLFCSHRDAQTVFGLTGEPVECARQLRSQARARAVVMTLGEQGVLCLDGDTPLHQKAAPVTILDRIGAGDALAAGVIDGWLAGNMRAALQYGTVMAALALSQAGDSVITTREEVERLVEAGDSSQLIHR